MKAQDIDRRAGISLVEQVVALIRRRMAQRQLAPGARLPSIRGLAESLGVSRSTVVEAYDRLVAEGAIHSRRGAGFFVGDRLPPLSLAELAPRREREVDPLWLTRQALESDHYRLRPGCGWLPAEWMPHEEIRRGLRQLARRSGAVASLTDYASPQGLHALRQVLAHRLTERGVEAAPSQILLTESGTQAIDLLCRFLLERGDRVLVDDPCYFNFHALLRAHRVKVVGVPFSPAGPDLSRLAEALEQHRPRLYITNSGLHNPTGASLSLAVAHRVLRLAERHDLLIIEDDIFADFEHQASPRLAALDGLERVIQVGSFSKTLSASVRCGYIAIRPEWFEELVDLKLATSFGASALSAELVFQLVREGAYRRHLNVLRTRLADAMGQVMPRLRSAGLEPWVEPSAGLFLWTRLPAGLCAKDVARAALDEDLVLAPGEVFSPETANSHYLRFNVAQSLDDDVFRALDRAMERAAKDRVAKERTARDRD
ncbi:PLP-dependent aminotransferase family protein [Halomonas sp.]|uniref:aminotransferase-like domain-containing protein n=1 Tax=Halomonas sp. TaxID=1486246 RepID=UPI000C96F2E2|nr:PLP-dependent aminotransferase family protein [Halomonas sp.]MAR73823.1 GntR family transcriptional regulator [Halomonas sp.]